MVRRSMSREKLLARSVVLTGEPVPAVAGVATAGLRVGSSVTRPGPFEEVGSVISHHLVGGGGGQPDVSAAPARDELDDLGDAAVLRLHLGGDAAEVERG